MNNRIAVISGASSGIGENIAVTFAREKIQLILIARNLKKLNKLRDSLLPMVETEIYQADLTEDAQVRNICSDIAAKYSKVDILVNNAGQGMFKMFDDTTVEDFRAIFEINFFAVVNITKQLLPLLKNSKHGHIVNIASVVSKRAFTNMSAYCASKFALRGFSLALDNDLHTSSNIRVSVVNPAATDTNFFKSSIYGDSEPVIPKNLIPPSVVAKEVLSIIRSPHLSHERTVPFYSRVVERANDIFPSAMKRLNGYMQKRAQNKEKR